MELIFALVGLILAILFIVLGVILEDLIGVFASSMGALVVSIFMYQIFADGSVKYTTPTQTFTLSGIPFVALFIVLISIMVLQAVTKDFKFRGK